MADFRLAFPMRPSEGFRIGVDFSRVMEEGDTATSQSITATDKNGASVTGTFLTQPAVTSAGLAKVKLVKNIATSALSPYTVRFHIGTAQGDDFERTYEVLVRD